MKRARYAFMVLILGIALLPAAGLAQAAKGQAKDDAARYDRFSIKLNYWTASYGGEIEVGDQDVFGGKGDRLNLADELGIENPQGVPEVAAWVRLGKHHRILASYFAVRYEGSLRLPEKVDIGGLTFDVASDLDTSFEFSRVTLMHQWNPLLNEHGRLGLQWGGQYYSWKFSYEGKEETTQIKKSDSASIPILIPVIGLDGQLVLGYGISLYGGISGIGSNFAGFQASYTDVNAGLAYDYKMLHAGLGYRTIDTRLKGEDDSGQIFESSFSHNGWLLSIGLNI
ncbi:MAG TPA: hypothetical protein VM658_03540 [bacterium]|nr:hypothetical protein [bacterium]